MVLSRKGILSHNTLIYVNKGHNKGLRDNVVAILYLSFPDTWN